MSIFFSSDCHFSHKNIISYCNRPFSCVEEMNEVIVHRWNRRVTKEDTTYLLGDVSFKNQFDWKSRLNGNIVVVAGNHDDDSHKLVKGYIKYGGESICLVHRPENYDCTQRFCFCGHVHNRWKFRKYSVVIPAHVENGVKYGKASWETGYMVNVGTDVWSFTPVTFEEIMLELKRIKKKEKIETWQLVDAPIREEFKNEIVDFKTGL